MKPIRGDSVTNYDALYYDVDSGEIVYEEGGGRRLQTDLEARFADLEGDNADLKARLERIEKAFAV